MSKDTTDSTLSVTVNRVLIVIVGVLIAALVADADSRLNQLNQKADDQTKAINLQSEKVTKLEISYAVIVTALNFKLPNLNLQKFIAVSTDKHIPAEKIATAVSVFETDPAQTKSYLENQLHFDSTEVSTVLIPTVILNKSSTIANPAKGKKSS